MKKYINSKLFLIWVLFCASSSVFSQVEILPDCGTDQNGFPIGATKYYRDFDADGYGNPSLPFWECNNLPQPTGYVLDNTDCNDAVPAFLFTLYYDGDGDGYGDSNNPGEFEDKGCNEVYEGYVVNSLDCDDSNPLSSPLTQWFLDANGDGVLSTLEMSSTPILSCLSPGSSYIYYHPIILNDHFFNYTHIKNYDSNGTIVGESRNYFDEQGKSSLLLSKDFINDLVWAKETVYDSFGRVSKTTFPAPSTYNSFQKIGFLSSSQTTLFSPNLVTYYSNNNNFEPYQATATQPYSEVEYDKLNPGNVIKSFGGNTIGGQWKTGFSYTMPAAQELYYIYGYNFFEGTLDTAVPPKEEIITKFYKTVNVDANGVENVVFTDGEGKTLASARSGITSPASITPYVVHSLINTQGYIDVHIPLGIANTSVSFIGGGTTPSNLYRVFDLKTGLEIVPLTTTSLSGGNFYRIVAKTIPTTNPKVYVTNNTTGVLSYDTGALGLSYSVNYYDYAINVYDKTGRLTKTLQPNAFKVANPTTIAIKAVPNHFANANYTTNYTYNTLGQVIEINDPDRGISKFAYRNDGQIRYSQSALQRNAPNNDNKISYTNYDSYGRPIESGIVTGTTGIWALATGATFGTNNSSVVTGTKSERVYTVYDDPSNSSQNSFPIPASHSLATLAPGYVLNNLSSKIAATYSSELISGVETITAVSYYSYNIYDKIEYIIQNNIGLGTPKIISYSYDSNGNISTIVFNSSTGVTDRFLHYFTYNIKGKLIKVQTTHSKNNPLVTEADYYYYKTGELKRTKIADGIQGMDYVYTLGGMLKSINHPSLEQAKDPGNDPKDLFGISLDYYPGDYNRLVGGVNNFQTHSSTSPDYVGNIKATRWANNSMDLVGASIIQKAYNYTYNRNNWITNAVFGTTNNGAAITPGTNGAYKEHTILYDSNGNITNLQRTNDTGVTVDNLTYNYSTTVPQNNKLTYVSDAVPATTNYPNDIDTGQTTTNYVYDALGQLVTDKKELTHYVYDFRGHVVEVRTGNVTFSLATPVVKFYYNERGQRMRKESFSSGVLQSTDFYIYDLSGNIMAIYNKLGSAGAVVQKELPIYGLSRIGVFVKGTPIIRNYEITDHLGNVRAIVQRSISNPSNAAMTSFADYYAFGEQLPIRNSNVGNYRFAFQGKELDNETGKEAFKLRLWDGRIGRWLSPDPHGQNYSPYMGMGNNPMRMVDPDGGYCIDSVTKMIIPCGDNNKMYEGPTSENMYIMPKLDEVTVFAKRKPLIGGPFDGKAFSELKNESEPYFSQYVETLDNSDFISAIRRDIKDLKTTGKDIEDFAKFFGAVSSIKLKDLKEVSLGTFKLTPDKLLFTHIYLTGHKIKGIGDDMDEVLGNYVELHKDNPDNQKGVYIMSVSFGSPAFGGMGGSVHFYYYDIKTKTYLGEAD